MAYVCFAAARAGHTPLPWLGLVVLTLGLGALWRRTAPSEKLPATTGSTLRALGWGLALWIAARLGPTGHAALDAAANLGIGATAVAAQLLLARIQGPAGMLAAPKAARSLDAALLVGFLWAVATALPAAYALFPAERVRFDPLAIDYATTSAGIGSLLVLIAAAFRLRSLRRLELGVGDRASGALALSLTAFFVAVPAALLDVAAPDRLLPVAVALASTACAWAATTPEPTLVSAALRGIIAVMVLGTPIALSAGVAARALPDRAGAIVLFGCAGSILAGLVARAVARPLGPEQSRWLKAIDAASRGALQPEPDAALRAALIALANAARTPDARPAIWRYHPQEVLSVDIAGYLHSEPAESPERLYEFALDEPERTLRAEVLRALEVRRPDVRGLLAWFDTRSAFSATVIVDEDGPLGFILLPRARRTTPLTLEEARAARILADRISALLSVSSALARSRQRELAASAEVESVGQECDRLRRAIVGQGDQHKSRAERLVGALRRTAYSPAARTTLDQLGKLGRAGADIALVVPAGVDPTPWAAHAHLESARAGGPLLVVDATQPGEQDGARWLDDERSPLTLGAGGTLLVIEPGLLPLEARTELGRALGRRTELDTSVLPGIRLFTASNDPPTTLAERGSLPPWLVRRLEQSSLVLPGLADRAEDLRALILDVLARQSLRLGREPLGVDNNALRLLIDHTWPANEIELESVLVRAALAAQGPAVSAADLGELGFRPEPLPNPEHTPVPTILRRRAPRRFPRAR
ncbi:MAG TPA: hypothetical protein VGP93_07195 [Polyangiaceae bacterium]|nr:hypothetical protein [Polyangiaceae bacterium]